MTTKANEINIEDIDDIGDGLVPLTPEEIAADAEDRDEPKDNTKVNIKPKTKSKPAFAPRVDDLADNIVKKDDKDDVEDVDEPKDDTDTDDVEENKTEIAEFYSGLTGVLRNKGILNIPEDTVIEDEEGFLNTFEENITARIDARTKKVEEYMRAGVPYTVVSKIEGSLAKAEAITEEELKINSELAKSLIISEFTGRGFGEEQAAKYFEMMEKAGPDNVIAEASKSLELRKANLQNMLAEEVKKAKKAKEDNKKIELELAENLLKSIEKPEIFGRKVAPATQAKLSKALNTVVGYDEDGEPLNALMKFKLENPVDFEHKLLYLFTVTNGFENLTAFDRSAETRVSKSFKNAVNVISSGKSFADDTSSPSQKTKIDMDSIDDIV